MPGLISWKRSEIARLRSRMEDLFDDFFGELPCRHFLPVSGSLFDWEVVEDDKAYVLKARLPNLDLGDLDVRICKDVLTVSVKGEKTRSREGGGDRSLEEARFAGMRSVRIPKRVNQEGIEASYRDDCLEILLPKIEKTTVKIHVAP